MLNEIPMLNVKQKRGVWHQKSPFPHVFVASSFGDDFFVVDLFWISALIWTLDFVICP
jgi:hypothetical protein